ncbi:MAG: ABC transporter transmembrane domain-containing protein, partial [Planctomycetota bacterium]
MKYFLQAVKEAGRHWPPLVAAFCCSLCVAALWSANIAALFPIIETTLSGKSPQQWNLEQLVNAEQSLAEHRAELAKLEAKIANAPDDERQQLTLESGAIQAKIDVAQAAMASAVWTRDCVTKWLPNQPFQTVLAVVCLVLIGTTLRVSFMLCNAVLVAWVSQSVARDIRGRVFSKALDLDARNFDAYGISGIQAQITHTTELLTNGITSFFSGAVTEPLRIISCLFVAMCISWRLTLASLIFAPIAAFLVMGLNRRVRALATRILDRSLTFHHIALDVLGAHQVVQSNLMEDFERARFNEATGEM